MLTHKLTEHDDWFINQNRIDSISRTRFQVGHEVVVCSNHHVMLAEFYNGQCNQSGCNSTKLIRFSRQNVQPVLRLKTWKNYKAAFVLTAVISFVLGFLFSIPFHILSYNRSQVDLPLQVSKSQSQVEVSPQVSESQSQVEVSPQVSDSQNSAEVPSQAVEEKEVEIESILVDIQSVVLELGESIQLYPQITPEDTVEKILTFSSSNPDVVEVNSTGLVTATVTANEGQERYAIVTIEAKNGVKTMVDVTVKDSYYTYFADEQIELKRDSRTTHTTPLLFLNTVPNCTGFTSRYCVSEVSRGDESSFAGQEFLIYGRTVTSEWQQLGSFIYESVEVESQLELSFSPRDLDQVICVMGEKEGGIGNGLSWTSKFSIAGVRYIN